VPTRTQPEDCFVRCCMDRVRLHEQSSQIELPRLLYQQLLLAAGGVFARNTPIQAANSRPFVEGPSVADRRDEGGGVTDRCQESPRPSQARSHTRSLDHRNRLVNPTATDQDPASVGPATCALSPDSSRQLFQDQRLSGMYLGVVLPQRMPTFVVIRELV